MSRSKRAKARSQARGEKQRLQREKERYESERKALAGIAPRNTVRRDITVRTFQMRAETADEKTRSVEAVLATDNPVLVFDMERWEIVEEILVMEGARFTPQVPMLDTHDRSSVSKQLGSTREIRVDGGQLLGRRFFSSVQDAADAFTKVREGHLTDGSIGYRVITSVAIEPGKTVEVEGESYTASSDRVLRVTTEWELKEDSVCPIGADVDAKMRTEYDVPTNQTEDRTMEELFELWCSARGIDPDKLSDKDREKREAECREDLKQRFLAGDKGKKPEGGEKGGEAERKTGQPQTFAEQLRAIAPRSIADADVDAVVLEFARADGTGNFEAAQQKLLRLAAERSKAVGTPEPEAIPEGEKGDAENSQKRGDEGKGGKEGEVDDDTLIRSVQNL